MDQDSSALFLPKASAFSETPPSFQRAGEASPRSGDGNFKMVADHAKDGILILTADGRYVYGNPMASQITGYSTDEIGAMGMKELMHPDVLPEAWVKLRKRLKGDHFPTPYETAIVNKTGDTVFIEVNGVKTVWAGEPADLVVIRDITAQKETEKKLIEKETVLREIAENIPGAVFQLLLRKDGAFSFPYMSERFQQFYGYEANAMETDPGLMFRLVPREDLSRNRRIVLESAQTLNTYEMEHRTVSPGGQVRWFHVKGTPRRLKNGETLWNGVAIDITAMKSAEQALEAARDELEKRVRERTAELNEVNSALRVLLNKREEDRTELEKKVFSNIKELVTPYLEKLQQTKTTTKQKTYLNLLESNIKEIAASFSKRLSYSNLNLTPAQIQVANMIKLGKNTKEIADLLNISARTVETHRKTLRKRLDLQHKKVNLRAFLLSFDK